MPLRLVEITAASLNKSILLSDLKRQTLNKCQSKNIRPPGGGVTNGLCEHLRAFASMQSTAIFLRARAEITKFPLRACEQRKNLGSTSKRALV